jgi:hypothetical protein
MTEQSKFNEVIKLTEDISFKLAEQKARKFLRENPHLANGYILITCPDVTDLFIIKQKQVRVCTSKEWANYFRTFMCYNQPRFKWPLKNKE